MEKNPKARAIISAVIKGFSDQEIADDPERCILLAVDAARAGLGLPVIDRRNHDADNHTPSPTNRGSG